MYRAELLTCLQEDRFEKEKCFHLPYTTSSVSQRISQFPLSGPTLFMWNCAKRNSQRRKILLSCFLFSS